MEDSMLVEILKEMQKKYMSIVEIEHITREMGDACLEMTGNRFNCFWECARRK